MAPRIHTTTPDIDAVTRLIEQVAGEIVLPKFRALRDDEILHKDTPGYADDLVTVVDGQAEARLVDGLTALFPARVVAEEGTHQHPDRLRLLASDEPLWIIDPLDGTHNFASGQEGFGVMVAFVVRGETRAGWVHLPARGESFVGAAGAGAYMNGARLHVPDDTLVGRPRGTFLSRFMPPHLRETVSERLRDHVTPATQSGAAAVEYTDVMLGRREFVAYFRLLPWDHAAPSLILTEAGGAVEHLDGCRYTCVRPIS